MDGGIDGRFWHARRITVLYLIVGVCWILASDVLVTQANLGTQNVLTAQLVKGSLFVAGSAGLLYALVGREQRALEATNTELSQSLRHVSVLHRVLRHNLRNSCDVIQNNAALLEAGTGDGEALARINRQTQQLTTLAEKSRHLREAVRNDADAVSLSVAAIVDEAAASVGRGTFDGDIDPAHAVRVHPRFVVGITELLDNAVTHHDDPSPTVRVSSSRHGDWVTIEIDDDGPGLPAAEYRTLVGECEDPLHHSRGIGLWLVRFLVEESNGTVDVTSGDGGTTVRIRVPAAEPTAV